MIEDMTNQPRSTPGPRRPAGAPVGPDQVRRALLDAAATLFAQRGIAAVSLRDIAAEADVHLALIRRYIGSREDLELAVFDDLSAQVARSVADHPLSGQGFTSDTVMGQWVRVTAGLTMAGRNLAGRRGYNPVQAMARTLSDGYGLDDRSALVRASQIAAAALGWRIFEDYLVEAGHLQEVPLEALREDLTRSARRLGATHWPSPTDPPLRKKPRRPRN